MNHAAESGSRLVAGSFRDPNGRVYRVGQRIVRGLSDQARKNFRELANTRVYRAFTNAGELTPTEEISCPDGLGISDPWTGWLEHQVVPVISYPYEWTFSMLRDAADLQLRLQEAALLEGWSMKDATPYNVQFVTASRSLSICLRLSPCSPERPGKVIASFAR